MLTFFKGTYSGCCETPADVAGVRWIRSMLRILCLVVLTGVLLLYIGLSALVNNVSQKERINHISDESERYIIPLHYSEEKRIDKIF
jgi:hypothetical protein